MHHHVINLEAHDKFKAPRVKAYFKRINNLKI